MDISLKCNVSLSKKLRPILEKEDGRIVLVVDRLYQGKGEGTLHMSGETIHYDSIKGVLNGETSIQLTPTEEIEGIASGAAVTNIFAAGVSLQGSKGRSNPISQMMVTSAPDKNERGSAIKTAEENGVPENFKAHQNQEFKMFVSNLSELMVALKAASGKKSSIDLDSMEDEREKAIAKEIKDREEGIDIPALIVNDSCGSLRINDLDLSLALNTPFNLNNISAKRLSESNELKGLIRANLVKFISPDQVDSYRSLAVKGVEKPGLETFDRSGAFDAIERGSQTNMPDAEPVDIDIDGVDEPDEAEQLSRLVVGELTNLTPMNTGVRVSHHGSAMPSGGNSRRKVPNAAKTNEAGIKTISKLT